MIEKIAKSTTSTYIEAKIAGHLDTFETLLGMSEHHAGAGNVSTAAAYAQVAASYASRNHTGLWSSHRLERLLGSIAGRISRTESSVVIGENPLETRENILHVLTAAYTLGGHTRTVWRWIDQDKTCSHSVVITRQGMGTVPQQLTDAVDNSGGLTFLLDGQPGGILNRAAALRALAHRFKRVILHVHPADVVPALAFSGGKDLPPTIYVNHADHLLWVGLSISDIVVHLREAGVAISVERRGIESKRCVLLPIPLGPVNRTMSRRRAKKLLGLPPDGIMLLSVASAYKYRPLPDELSFLELVLPVVRDYKQVVLVVVGPDDLGDLGKESHEVVSRIKVFGKQVDVSPFYEAADIYLDPIPFSSTTSFLEAGSYGLPLVSFTPDSSESCIFAADSPGVTTTLIRGSDPATYRSSIGQLIEDSHSRRRLGVQTHAEINLTHCGNQWEEQLAKVYSCADNISRASSRSGEENRGKSDRIDIGVSCLNVNSGLERKLQEIIADEAGLFPLLERFHLLVSAPTQSYRRLGRFMFCEWRRQRLRRLFEIG